jgi:protein ImuA
MNHLRAREIDALRARIARVEAGRSANRRSRTLRFGLPAIDDHLPGKGLPDALHEVAGTGPEIEHGTAAALFTAGLLARRKGTVLWVQEWPDLFAPALAKVGLGPERVIYLQAGRHVLAAMEEGLRSKGLVGVVGESMARVTLTASRRLQLTAEQSGVPGFLLRRSRKFDDPRLSEPNAAATRWRITSLPSPAPLKHAPDVPGLARAVWRLNLTRCRGGETATWIVEACDAQGHLSLVPQFPDRAVAQDRRRAAGGRAHHHLPA